MQDIFIVVWAGLPVLRRLFFFIRPRVDLGYKYDLPGARLPATMLDTWRACECKEN